MISMTTNNGRGRTVKFTPERINQIINLVERGTPREEIANIIGCSVGSLQVTCSRLGVSLRRIRPSVSAMSKMLTPDNAPSSGNGSTNGEHINIIVEAPAPAPVAPTKPQLELSLVLRSGERERVQTIPLPQDVLVKLSLEATIRGETIAELITEILRQSDK
jgi:hypothetical protein